MGGAAGNGDRLQRAVVGLLSRLGAYVARRERQRSAGLACKTAELVLSSAPANSAAAESALRALLRHCEWVEGQQLTTLLATLEEALETTREPDLRQRILTVLEQKRSPFAS